MDLDDIRRELATIQDMLLALDDDATQRESLIERQSELRVRARELSSLTDDRPTEAVVSELTSLVGQLEAITGQKIDLVKQSVHLSGTSFDALPEATLNRQLMEAQGADKLEARIRHLQKVLDERGAAEG